MVNVLSYRNETKEYSIGGVKLFNAIITIENEIYHCDSSFSNSTDDMLIINIINMVSPDWRSKNEINSSIN